MKLAWVTVLIPLAACGRAGFDPVPPTVLDCAAAPSSFQLNANVQEIAATSTTDGYAVFTTDDKGDVSGTVFALSPIGPAHALIQGAVIADIATGAGGRQIGAFASGDEVELAIPVGDPSAPTGFTRVPLTAELAPNGAPSSVTGWTAQAGSVAFTTTGVAAYLQQTTGMNSPTVEASIVAAPGDAPSPPVTLKQSTDQISGATIVAAGDKFLLTWIASNTGDVLAQMFTADLQPASGAVQVTSPGNSGAKMARAAFTGGQSMFVWSRKDTTGADQVWFSLLDAQLAPVAGDMLSPTANIGSVVAGATDFLVAWQEQNALVAAHIGLDGSRHDALLDSNGGVPLASNSFIAAWDMVSHNGQPALIWGEVAADNGPKTLWVDPLCFAQP